MEFFYIGNYRYSVGNYSFQNCSSILGFSFSANVTNIGNYAFQACSGLTNIVIPGSSLIIGSGAFQSSGLLTAELPLSMISQVDTSQTTSDVLFYGCVDLANISFPGTPPDVVPNGITSLGTVFEGAGITNMVLPEGLASLAANSFAFCDNLYTANIPSTLTSIPNQCFYGSGLTKIVIPNTVTNIGMGAFFCPNLHDITLSSSVGILYEQTFSFCTNLYAIKIPASIKTLGLDTFFNCSNLNSVFFEGNAPSVGSIPFAEDLRAVETNLTVYYLPGTTGWSNTYSGFPAVMWNPQFLTSNSAFGLASNQFGFSITGTSNIPIVLQASTNASGGPWVSLQTFSLTNGMVHYSDSQWTNFPSRFYRLIPPG